MHTNEPGQTLEQDADQLRALGYESHFDRTMSKWENFSLGFTYLSPVVGVYTIFAIAFVAGGPPMWWTYIGVGLGQLMVCLIFGEIVSQFPISGGLYPWARRLVGKRWAWMAGWVYAWALCCTMAGVATGAAPFLAQLFAVDSAPAATTTIALVLIGLTTALNLSGTRLLARVAMFGFICELGLDGESDRPRLRHRRDRQHELAAQPGRSLVCQLRHDSEDASGAGVGPHLHGAGKTLRARQRSGGRCAPCRRGRPLSPP